MTGGIPESDWKIFRELHPVWLNRYCTEINDQILRQLSDKSLSPHERYLDVYKFIHRMDKEVGDAFNDFRRSTAVIQIRIIWNLGVVTEEELARFSESTRSFILM